MNELFALLSFAAGVPLLLIGYITAIISVKQLNLPWRASMVVAFPLTLPVLQSSTGRAPESLLFIPLWALRLFYTPG